MRLTSDFFVSALLRRVFGAGGFGAIIKRGSAEAGSIFVLYRQDFRTVSLYGPAPQSTYDSAKPDDRFFSALLDGVEDEQAQRRLEQEQKFDSDIWVVEIEQSPIAIAELLRISPP